MPKAHLLRRSLPAIDLLESPTSKAYFDAREHAAFYIALKGVDARRDFHAKLLEVCDTFLELTSSPADQALVDELMSRNPPRATTAGDMTKLAADAQRRNPRGYQLLNLMPPLTLEYLRKGYRAAVLEHHPDRGGQNEDMISINEAYTELHALVIEQQSAPETDPEADTEYSGSYSVFSMLNGWESNTGEARVLKCADFRFVIARLLLSVHLDDWALDTAYRYLRLLTSAEWAVTPYTKNGLCQSQLVGYALKLAKRLSLAGLTEQAEVCLQVARDGRRAAKAEYAADGLRVTSWSDEWMLLAAGGQKVVLKHPRQADNALRLGIIDQKRHQKVSEAFLHSRGAKNTREVAQAALFAAYAQNLGFLQRLPTDAIAAGKSLPQGLVPDPPHYPRLCELSDGQQAEYTLAFGIEPIFKLVRKYLFARLHCLLETAILHDSGPSLEELEREARLLSQLRGDNPEPYSVAVADVIRFLGALATEERTERLRLLRLLAATPTGVILSRGRGINADSHGASHSVQLVATFLAFVQRPLPVLRQYAEGR